MKNEKVAEIVANKIADLLKENSKLPYEKQWNTHYVPPQNLEYKKPYRGLNHLLCTMIFPDPYFLTFNQIRKMKGKLKKGAKGFPIIKWNWLYLDENGKKVDSEDDAHETIGYMRYHTLFNQKYIEGIEFPKIEVPQLEQFEKIEACEKIIEAQDGLTIVHEGQEACYNPLSDIVKMPDPKSFISEDSYYSILFHEVAHWTGHESRLARFQVKVNGIEEYAAEELVAEMTAAFLCFETGILNDRRVQNNAAYIQAWLRRIRNNPQAFIRAGSAATKAFDYITKKTKES